MRYSLKRWPALFLSAALLLGALSACGTESGEDSGAGSTEVQNLSSISSSDTANPRTPATLDLTDATVISLSGSSAAIDGDGAQAEDSVVTITEAGIYAVSGILTDGRIIVDAPGAEVTVALNGADITCSYSSPLYIYDADAVTVHLMAGTDNTLTDGASYSFADAYSSEADEEPNACLYSEDDLVIEGAGSLTVNANYNNGITGKDTLQVYDGVITVTAVNHGVNGRDSNTIDSVTLTVTCGGDAIRSTNDTDSALGWISISNSTLDLTAGEDGVQAETAVTVSSGSYTISSGGGSAVQPSDDTSAKGIKAGITLTLASGVYALDCSDDALHANGDVTVAGGVYTISSGDDAFHADEALTVSGGTIDVQASYEGLEGSTVEVSGGTIYIISSDDGLNAAGGADGSGFGGFGPGNIFGGASSDYYINISGGYLVVEAGGDGLDSNGTIAISGGTVLVASTGQDDGALDCEGTLSLSGGTLLAVDSSMMSQTPNDVSQYTVSLGFGTTLSAGTYVSLSSGEQSIVFQLPVNTSNLVFSSPELEEGAAYTVSYGGSYSGTAEDWICSGGTYSGGTELTELTLSDYLTTYGNSGMGGPGGNMGSGMGGRGGNMPQENNGQPADGELPTAAPDAGSSPPDTTGTDGMAPADSAPGDPPDGGTAPAT